MKCIWIRTSKYEQESATIIINCKNFNHEKNYLFPVFAGI